MTKNKIKKFTVSVHLDTEQERRDFKVLCAQGGTDTAGALREFIHQSNAAGKLVIRMKSGSSVSKRKV